jgi:O-antigen/teichoic acid export membrane protein
MVQAIFGVIGALALVAITPFLVERILNITPALRGEAKPMFYRLALAIPAILVSSSLSGMLRAAQRFDLVNSVGASFSVANSLLTLVSVLFFDWPLPKIVTILVVSRFLSLVVHYWLCMCVFPSFKGRPCFHRTELYALIGFGGWVTVSSVVGPILVYLDRFMIGALLSMAAVAYYAVPYEIVIRLWIIPTSIGAALFPVFSVLIGQGQWERLVSFLWHSVKWVLLTLGFVVVMVAVLAHDILQLWLGSAFAEESTLVLQILVVGVLINSLAHVPYSFIQALGRPDLTAKFHLAELPLQGLLVWWLINLWGITGAALAWSIRVSIDALLLFVAARRLASLPVYSCVSDKLIETALFLFLFAGIAIGISSLSLVVWLRFLGLGITFLAVVVGVWHYLLNGTDRDQIAGLFRSASVT